MKRRDVMGLIGTLALAGCTKAYRWNQKLTVSVNTPQGLKTGSAVTEVTANYGTIWLSGSKVSYTLRGEATVVEVAPGKFLFALLSNGGTRATPTYELATQTWLDQLPQVIDGDVGPSFGFVTKLREARPLQRKDYPSLVTFANIHDPKSVKEVDPGKLSDAFGQGYSISSMVLEMTNEKKATGRVKSILPWLTQYHELLLDGSRYPNAQNPSIANRLSAGSFDTEN